MDMHARLTISKDVSCLGGSGPGTPIYWRIVVSTMNNYGMEWQPAARTQARHSSALHSPLTELSGTAGASAFYFCSANCQRNITSEQVWVLQPEAQAGSAGVFAQVSGGPEVVLAIRSARVEFVG